MPLGAIILAAGASRRMGIPKSLLPLGGGTFLSRITGSLREAGVGEIVIVLGADEGAIRPTLGWFDGAVVTNRRWEQGQLSSVIAGLDALEHEGVEGAILWPVDHPLVGAGVVRDLAAGFGRTGKQIIVPTCRGWRGHPVLFSAELFPALRSASTTLGARDVLRRHPQEVQEVPTEDEGILRNIDTPEDARGLSESHPEK